MSFLAYTNWWSNKSEVSCSKQYQLQFIFSTEYRIRLTMGLPRLLINMVWTLVYKINKNPIFSYWAYGRNKTKQNKKPSHFQQLRMALCNLEELKSLVYMYNARIRTLLKFPSHHLFYNRAICFSEPHKTFRFVSKSGIGKSQLCILLRLAKMYIHQK